MSRSRWLQLAGLVRGGGRYTANVRVRMRVLVSLVTVIVLAGSPAVTAVCAALCGPAGGHTAGHTAVAPTGHEGHAVAASVPAARVDDPQLHVHHHGAPEMAASAAVPPRSDVVSGNCCAFGDRILSSFVATVRHTVDGAPAQATGSVPVFSRPTSGYVADRHGGPAPPALAPGTPRVLRI